jgi:hypothetical protein
MTDATYQPKVYRKSGGDEQVIANGGTQTVESGGIINITTGGKFQNNGVDMDLSAGIATATSSTTAELDTLAAANAVLATEAAAGITGGVGTIYRSTVHRLGGIIKSSILIDLTGLGSSTTDLDIIGQGASAAHIGRITAARSGTILSGRMTCLEVPVGGADDIDLYSATVGTGVFNDLITDLTETALVTAGGAWTLGLTKAITGIPTANDYLYLCGGEAGTAASYTAGKFLIEFDGYDA